MPKVLCALVAAVFFAIISTSQGYAATIPAAIGQSHAYIFSEGVQGVGFPSSATYIAKDGAAIASASVFGGAPHHVVISVSAIASDNPNWPLSEKYGIHSEAGATYYMEVIGPSGWVPLNVQYSLSRYSSGHGSAGVEFGLGTLDGSPWGDKFNVSSCPNSNCPPITSTEKLTVPTNILFAIGGFASAWAATGDDYLGGTAQAQGDVYFYFDPGFADARNYSLVFSPNIVNEPISSVPLPAALPLFGSAALGLLAFAKRRGKADLSAAV